MQSMDKGMSWRECCCQSAIDSLKEVGIMTHSGVTEPFKASTKTFGASALDNRIPVTALIDNAFEYAKTSARLDA
jgi:hypothetical protein